jgi:DNA-binding response OmpR family regulator
MIKHVLLVEPYPELRDLLTKVLHRADCKVDCVMTGYEMEVALRTTQYDVVLLNIDQNREQNFGLKLAARAADGGSHIIMIPDYKTDRAAIAAKGWLQISKPFRLADLNAVIAQAIGPAGEASAVRDRAAHNKAG